MDETKGTAKGTKAEAEAEAEAEAREANAPLACCLTVSRLLTVMGTFSPLGT